MRISPWRDWILRPSTALLALLLFFLLRSADPVRTDISVEISPGHVRVVGGEKALEADTSVLPLGRIRIESRRSLFPVHLRSVDYAAFDSPVWQPLALPPLAPPTRGLPSLGDWWTDMAVGPEEVLRVDWPHNDPVRLRFSFSGRSTESIAVLLDGNGATAGVGWRRGLMNNDIFLYDGSKQVAGTTSLSASLPALSLRVAWLLALALLLALSVPAPVVLLARLVPTMMTRLASRTSLLMGARAWGFLLAAVSCAGFCWVASHILDRMPHFPDDFGYLMRARWLLQGQLHGTAPFDPSLQDWPFTQVHGDRFVTSFPITWPLVLAAFDAFGQAWLAPPFLTGLAILALWHLGRRLYGPLIGLTAALLMAAAPLTSILGASLMGHCAALFFSVLGVLGGAVALRDRSLPWTAASGASFGLLFGTRPLTAFTEGIIFALWACVLIARGERTSWRQVILFIASGLATCIPVFLDNHSATGSFLTFAYTMNDGHSWRLDSIPSGLQIADGMIVLTPVCAFGWGWPWTSGLGWPLLGCALALLPFLLGKANRFDTLLALIFAGIPVAYLGMWFTGGHAFGPRYYFDVYFCLFLLAARGLEAVVETTSPRAPQAALGLVAAALLLAGVGTTLAIAPSRLARYHEYDGATSRLTRELVAKVKPPAVVILDRLTNFLDWVDASPLLEPRADAPLLFFRGRSHWPSLFARYPSRTFYLWQEHGLDEVKPDSVRPPS